MNQLHLMDAPDQKNNIMDKFKVGDKGKVKVGYEITGRPFYDTFAQQEFDCEIVAIYDDRIALQCYDSNGKKWEKLFLIKMEDFKPLN